jgi:hypothetical protein
MFIRTEENRLVNLDNVDYISLNWDDEPKRNIKFIKSSGWRNGEVIGYAEFDTKEDMQSYIDKYLKPLKYDRIKEISQGLINLEYVLRGKL